MLRSLWIRIAAMSIWHLELAATLRFANKWWMKMRVATATIDLAAVTRSLNRSKGG